MKKYYRNFFISPVEKNREFTENGTQKRKYISLLFEPSGKFNQIGKIERYYSTSVTVLSITRIEESQKCW